MPEPNNSQQDNNNSHSDDNNSHSDDNNSHSDDNNSHSDDNNTTTSAPEPLQTIIITETIHDPLILPQHIVNTENTVISNLDPTVNKLTLNETITGNGYVVTNQQGTTQDGSEITHTTFITTDNANHAPNISEDLTETVVQYFDDEQVGETSVLLNEIKLYAGKIKCSDFHGKGTIEDYSELFVAAAKIANETKQMQLDVDIEGFSEFGQAADDLSALFNSFIVKLQNVSIIDDSSFLRSVSIALKKIWNLSEVFGRFKDTILATSTVKVPKSAHDTSVILSSVMEEVNCALTYINNFVNTDPTASLLPEAALSADDKKIIDTATSTIDNWNTLCNQGVSIAMTNNPDVQNINQVNTSLKTKTNLLQSYTNALKAKFTNFNIKF